MGSVPSWIYNTSQPTPQQWASGFSGKQDDLGLSLAMIESLQQGTGIVNNANWSGTALAIGNGGTGQTSASAAFNALSPLTTAGDLLYGGASGAGTRLAAGTSSQVLWGGTTPSWGAVVAPAGTLSGGTLASGVTASSLTSFGSGIALGTPASGTLTNCTGLPIAGTTGYGTGVATALAANVNGSGAISLATSPTFVTPALGAASATTINKVALTAPATGSTLTIADGKTLTASNTLTLTGTDSSSVAFGTGGTVAYTNAATLSSLTSIGTIGTGVWNGTAVAPAYGGTGVANNAANTLTFSGNYSLGLTLSANTALTLPQSGQLATILASNINYTVGPTGANFTTVANALAALGNEYLGALTYVTLNIADGIYTSTSPISVFSNNFRHVSLQGNTYTTSLTSVASVSGSAGAWSAVLNVASTANFYVGGLVVLSGLSGGTGGAYQLAGCWKVTAISGNQITVAITNQWGALATGAVTGTVAFLAATLSFTNCNGLNVYDGAAVLQLAGGVCFAGSSGFGSGSATIGLDVEDAGRMLISGTNGVNGFGYGVFCNYGSDVVGNGLVAASNCANQGFECDSSATISLGAIIATGCYNGVQASAGGVIRKGPSDVVCGNASYGLYATQCGIILENASALVSTNVEYGAYQDTGGYITVFNGANNANNNNGNSGLGVVPYASCGHLIVGAAGAIITDTAPIAPQTLYATNATGLALITPSTGQSIGIAFAESDGAKRLAIQKNTDNTLGIYTLTGVQGSEVPVQQINIDTSGNVVLETSNLTLDAGTLTINKTNAEAIKLVTPSTGQTIDLDFAESGGAIRFRLQKDASNNLATFFATGAAGSESFTNHTEFDHAGNIYNYYGSIAAGTHFAIGSTQVVGAQQTGYGTPTGGAKQASFAASTITLPNLAAAVAQLIVDLKTHGLLGA